MSLSIVLPAFNEATNILDVISGVDGALRGQGIQYEIIVVNDGSTDDTATVLSGLSDNSNLKIVTHEVNKGYGQALRSGFDAAKYDWLFFMDADRQFDFKEIVKLMPHMPNADLIIGYRKSRNDKFLRSVNSKIYNLAVLVLFGIKVKDLNCAFKLMRTSMVRSYKLETIGALINAEMLVKAKRARHIVVEVPVSHYPRISGTPTGSNIKVIIKAFRELIAFRMKKHA